MTKRVVELSEFDFTYKLLKVLKAQTLADFIVYIIFGEPHTP